MRIRSFIIAYALVLAILLFADRRPGSTQQDHYSHVVDLTDGQNVAAPHVIATESRTHIIAPGALIPGTWSAGQIPPERLVASLVVMDLNATVKGSSRISLDDIAAWESQHGMIPQGAVVAIRRAGAANDLTTNDLSTAPLPIARDAAQFLIEARYTIGFAVETPVNLTSDRTLARQLALHGSYVLEGTARFTSLPATGALIIVAPAKNKNLGAVPVRILAMVR
ncbi:MAG TPA: cyclase family protein [Terriglobales bacterium]|jgi:kynurenine formamidase|nr:cyclase family protein [Terriglobales bacterium]